MINDESFSDVNTNLETPNSNITTEKPLTEKKKNSKRVDINILKSKLQETESRELRKNIYILSSLVLGLSVLGIYLSL